jgi:hypothetical protein
MARARVTASTLKRLTAVDTALAPPDDGGKRGGVLEVPAIASLDDWEKVAMASQQKLVRETQEHLDPRPAWQPTEGGAFEARRYHAPDPSRRQEAVPMCPPPPLAIR